MLSAFRSRKKPLAGGDLGLDPSVKLIIGEHLSADQQTLLLKSKEELVKTKLFSYVWFQNNKILARAEHGKKIEVISSIEDINRLKISTK